jgi:Spy/CpxP family protein refolding chaperone
MRNLGTRMGILFGMALLVSTAPVWAQSPSVVSARQSEEAQAKAQLEAAQAKAKAAEATAPKKQVIIQSPLGARLQTEFPYLQSAPYTTVGRDFNLQWNFNSAKDPLAALQVGPGTWWNNADTVSRLGLTKEQQKKMDDIFQQFRLTLIDLNASLSKEELILDPLIAAEKLDEVKILTQIDRIAQARAELEKANSRMLLGIRQSLTMEQWTKIQASPATYRITTTRR